MNILTACATYTGHVETFNGLKALRCVIPDQDKNGNSKPDIPIFIVPNPAAESSCKAGVFEVGTNLLIEGRVYKRHMNKKQKEEKIYDDRLYVVPTCELQAANKELKKNRVDLAGACGFIESQNNSNVINFGLVCPGAKQEFLNVVGPNNLNVAFKIAAWSEDCRRLRIVLFIGRQLAIGGKISFNTYTNKDGVRRCEYRITVKSNQASSFGDNFKVFAEEDLKKGDELDIKKNYEKKCREAFRKDGPKNTNVLTGAPPEVFETPHQQAIAKPANDGIPF